MATEASAQILGGKFGEEGTNTFSSPRAAPLMTVVHPDGFSVVAPGEMYLMNEQSQGRREPGFPGLHNLHDSVMERTLKPPTPIAASSPDHQCRAMLWDITPKAVHEALAGIPSGSHVVICANSGPCNASLEDKAPWTTVPGAVTGLLFVAEFRREDTIHPTWHQIATPIRPTEGRLLAGLRLLATVTGGCNGLTFTFTNLTHPTVPLKYMNLVKDSLQLPYGAVANAWKPTNLGC